jgi:soluble cytochrome b562
VDTKGISEIKTVLELFNVTSIFNINTFGFGLNHDPKYLSGIAQLTGGNYYLVEPQDNLSECLADCIGDLVSNVAHECCITIKPESSDIFRNIKITKTYGFDGVWKEVDGAWVTNITYLKAGTKKNFVFELQIPATKEEIPDDERNIPIINAVCVMKRIRDPIQHEVKKKIQLWQFFLNEKEEKKEEEQFDTDVVLHYFRVKGAEAMQKAKQLLDQGKAEEAKKSIKAVKDELINLALNENEINKYNLIEDIDAAYQSLAPEIYETKGKHLLYQNTRALMEERSNLINNMEFTNAVQTDMINKAKEIKKIG